MIEYVTYEKLESQYRKNDYTRKCINGKITGCSNCVGYCMYEEHKGYLTNDLRKQHNCINKNCNHYIAKTTKEKNNLINNPFAKILGNMKQIQKDIFELACKLTDKYEGMSFINSSITSLGKCELSYVTISNDYMFEKIIKKIEQETGYSVSLKQLDYSFDRVAEIIMNKVII